MRNRFFIRRLIAEYPPKFAVIPIVRLPMVARKNGGTPTIIQFFQTNRASLPPNYAGFSLNSKIYHLCYRLFQEI